MVIVSYVVTLINLIGNVATGIIVIACVVASKELLVKLARKTVHFVCDSQLSITRE